MRFKYRSHSQNIYDSETGRIYTGGKAICELLNELNNEINTYDAGNQLLKRSFDECRKENEQLKQFPVKLENRIQKLEESLKALKEMETDDLNPQAVEDVAIVIEMSLNALMEFRKELKGDVE